MNDPIGNATAASGNINRSVERERLETRQENEQQAETGNIETPTSNEPQIERAAAVFAQQQVTEVSTNISTSDEAIAAVRELRAAIADNPQAASLAQANVERPTVEATL